MVVAWENIFYIKPWRAYGKSWNENLCNKHSYTYQPQVRRKRLLVNASSSWRWMLFHT